MMRVMRRLGLSGWDRDAVTGTVDGAPTEPVLGARTPEVSVV
ncbi:hypothetical protein SAMN04488133_2764 [Halobellus limi]|uniref:Uncharacterized protein n=1 Tax=Halobellus limi TaxID=699433 RepID=A0A1H6BCN8_9EURY|nr:hypothetical protein SAMN04488133_2764 [Halobellus limi]